MIRLLINERYDGTTEIIGAYTDQVLAELEARRLNADCDDGDYYTVEPIVVDTSVATEEQKAECAKIADDESIYDLQIARDNEIFSSIPYISGPETLRYQPETVMIGDHHPGFLWNAPQTNQREQTATEAAEDAQRRRDAIRKMFECPMPAHGSITGRWDSSKQPSYSFPDADKDPQFQYYKGVVMGPTVPLHEILGRLAKQAGYDVVAGDLKGDLSTPVRGFKIDAPEVPEKSKTTGSVTFNVTVPSSEEFHKLYAQADRVWVDGVCVKDKGEAAAQGMPAAADPAAIEKKALDMLSEKIGHHKYGDRNWRGSQGMIAEIASAVVAGKTPLLGTAVEADAAKWVSAGADKLKIALTPEMVASAVKVLDAADKKVEVAHVEEIPVEEI